VEDLLPRFEQILRRDDDGLDTDEGGDRLVDQGVCSGQSHGLTLFVRCLGAQNFDHAASGHVQGDRIFKIGCGDGNIGMSQFGQCGHGHHGRALPGNIQAFDFGVLAKQFQGAIVGVFFTGEIIRGDNLEFGVLLDQDLFSRFIPLVGGVEISSVFEEGDLALAVVTHIIAQSSADAAAIRPLID